MSSKAAPAMEKPVPQNIEAERSVLGAVLLDNNALVKAAEHLHSGDFFLSQHERIFRKMLALADAQKPIDLMMLTDELQAGGELDSAGGAPYVASLADGMPKVSNVEHYAKIVAEKSRLRKIMHIGNDLFQGAGEKDAASIELLGKIESFVKDANSNGFVGDRKLVAVDLRDFLTMTLDKIDFIIEPILPVSNSAMIFSPTGAGKTYIMLYLAYCVAVGRPECFVWNIPSARPVVYVDGEMDCPTLQERGQEIARGFMDEGTPGANFFKLITPDLQKKFPPRINTKDGRARIEDHCTPGGLLVLDNIVTLCPGGDDKESEDWAVIQEWILYLRRKRIAVFLVQHAGKSGDQLGTSKKEIQLSCNLKLRTASDYTPEDGLRVEARLTKLRRRGKDGRFEPRWVQPFEIVLRVEAGTATFSTRPMLDLLKKKAVEMLIAGMRENDVAQETGLSRFVIYRLKQRIKSDGAAAATDA
jgi:hypothetical protein